MSTIQIPSSLWCPHHCSLPCLQGDPWIPPPQNKTRPPGPTICHVCTYVCGCALLSESLGSWFCLPAERKGNCWKMSQQIRPPVRNGGHVVQLVNLRSTRFTHWVWLNHLVKWSFILFYFSDKVLLICLVDGLISPLSFLLWLSSSLSCIWVWSIWGRRRLPRSHGASSGEQSQRHEESSAKKKKNLLVQKSKWMVFFSAGWWRRGSRVMG